VREGESEVPSAKAHRFSGSSFGALPDKMRRDAKCAEAPLPRMNAGAPTEDRSARNAGVDRTLSGEKNDGRALAEKLPRRDEGRLRRGYLLLLSSLSGRQ
jgi:hypothetical protein